MTGAHPYDLPVVVSARPLLVAGVHGVVALVGLEAAGGARVAVHRDVVAARHHPHLQLAVRLRVRGYAAGFFSNMKRKTYLYESFVLKYEKNILKFENIKR